mgnify:CR=1 FL=1
MSYIQSLPIGSILRGNAYEYQIEKILGQGSFGITYLGNVKIEGTLGSINNNTSKDSHPIFKKLAHKDKFYAPEVFF